MGVHTPLPTVCLPQVLNRPNLVSSCMMPGSTHRCRGAGPFASSILRPHGVISRSAQLLHEAPQDLNPKDASPQALPHLHRITAREETFTPEPTSSQSCSALKPPHLQWGLQPAHGRDTSAQLCNTQDCSGRRKRPTSQLEALPAPCGVSPRPLSPGAMINSLFQKGLPTDGYVHCPLPRCTQTVTLQLACTGGVWLIVVLNLGACSVGRAHLCTICLRGILSA